VTLIDGGRHTHRHTPSQFRARSHGQTDIGGLQTSISGAMDPERGRVHEGKPASGALDLFGAKSFVLRNLIGAKRSRKAVSR